MKNFFKRIFGAGTPDKKTQDQDALNRILNPMAQNRWITISSRGWTPIKVEQTFAAAMGGDLTEQWNLFDLMEETWPALQKNLCELKDSVTALDWVVQPYTDKGMPPTPEAIAKAELVQDLIWGMAPKPDLDEFGFEDTIWNLLDARGKGISVLEIDWELRTRDTQMVYAPRCTRYVGPRFYGFPSTGEDRLMLKGNELAQTGFQTSERWIVFPPNKFLIGICKAKSSHPISAPMLRVLAFWWAAANFSREWFLNVAQLFGQPIRWASYDPNLSEGDQNKLADMLANMGSAAWAMFPAGTQLELKEASKTAGDNPNMALLNFADKVCDLVILRQTLTSDVGSGGSGSRALGEVHERVLTGVKQSLASWTCRILNQQLIPAICRLNFGNQDDLPYFAASLREIRDRKATAEGLKAARDAGVSIPVSWAHEQLDIPQPGPGDDVISPSAANPMAGLIGKTAPASGHLVAHAASATDKLVDHVLENITGVEAAWLAGVKPFFRDLLEKAEDPHLSDDDFRQVIEAAQARIPHLFDKLDSKTLANAMEAAMGAAAVNGAVKGYLKRGFGAGK